MEVPRFVIADALWAHRDTMTAAEKKSLVSAIKDVWSPELAAIWEPSTRIAMEEWLEDHCITDSWRERVFDSWQIYSDDDCPRAFDLESMHQKIPSSAKRYSVIVTNLPPAAPTYDIAFIMSAIADNAPIARVWRPKHPNGASKKFVIVDYLYKAHAAAALDWSDRITFRGNVLSIEESNNKK
jgi:hypothetical protein